MQQKSKSLSGEAIRVIIRIQSLILVLYVVIFFILRYWCHTIDFTPCTSYNTILPVIGCKAKAFESSFWLLKKNKSY